MPGSVIAETSQPAAMPGMTRGCQETIFVSPRTIEALREQLKGSKDAEKFERRLKSGRYLIIQEVPIS